MKSKATSGTRGITTDRLLSYGLFLLSILLLFSGCQNQAIDSDGDGWNDERERIEGTNPNLADSDRDGFSDPKDWKPLDDAVPDDSEKTTDSVVVNETIEDAVKYWADNDMYGISRDIGDFIQIPVIKDILAKFVKTAMEKTLQWQILHVDKSYQGKQHKVKATLEMVLKVPTAQFQDITSGDIEVQDIISKGIDIANYRISVVYDLAIEDGTIISSEIDTESSSATLEQGQ